ncbi:phage tail protein [Paenibacillus apiarius]|uniref:Uncharacterized protein n=1 Tax=Paenibacillus apiarius TaxID=46240 RepID=A0ABT4DQT4_9BACL|nr:hypothetical protein [Paenibacillus apiarius]MCY9513319.1 hypothetical protein [Paenibacillus apiarius]MCY9519709.1 hypothetical protein [Paenibacillus apiarius]MCY9553235.1 hypothetical protein [Paenibacillus apiarius]MCY9557085.1 hypothetical protein [Paenibacillus apiarius]MCY9682174.1 hypothetical protein [Paenibacillus apiarius]
MAATTLEELQILITSETSGLKKELNSVKSQLRETNTDVKRSTESIGGHLKKLGGIFAGVFAVKKMIDYGREAVAAYNGVEVAGAKLERVMRNTMNATDGQIASIKQLAAAQQDIGVVAADIQFSGMQELGTYLSQADSLKTLLPTLNDMLAQQYGLDATHESAANVATMIGKVMDGQLGALSRYGYSWTEAQEKILKYGNEAQRAATLAEVVADSVGGMNEALARTPAGQMRQLQFTLGAIKEEIGKGLQPVILAVLPYVQALANAIMRIVQYFSALMSALFGVSKAQEQVGKSAAGAANAQEGIGDAAEKSGKKASKSVAGFDEINQLVESTGNAAEDGLGGMDFANDMPDWNLPNIDTDIVPAEIQAMADKVKKILTNIFEPMKKAWDKHGPGVAREFNRAIEGTKATLQSFGDLMGSVWDNGGAAFLENIVGLGLEITRLGLRIYNDFILPVVGWFVDFLNPETNAATRGILDGINWLLEKMTEFVSYLAGDGFGYVQIALGGLAGALLGLAVYKTIIGIIEFVKGFAVAIKGLMAAMVSNPITLVVVAVGALIGAFVTAYMTNEDFRKAVNALWEKLKNFLIPVFETVKSVCLDVWVNVLVPLGAFLKDVFVAAWDAVVVVAKFLWNDILVPFGEFLLWFWESVVTPLVDILAEGLAIAFETVAEVAQILWEDVLVPLGQFLAEAFHKVIEGMIEVFSHWWNKILKPFGEYLKGIFQPIMEGIIKVYQFLWKNVLKPLIEFYAGTFKVVFETVGKSVKDIINGLKTVFGGLIDFIVGVFTGNWQKAWEGVKNIFKGIFDSLWGIVKAPLNLIIGGINKVIDGLNSLSIDIPDWMGGGSFGLTIPKIPPLARGGIVDSPTLALIGEAGKEAVVPLENTSFVNNLASALGSAVMAAMQMSGGGQSQAPSGGGDVILQLDGTTLARMINPYLTQEQGRIGGTIIQPL